MNVDKQRDYTRCGGTKQKTFCSGFVTNPEQNAVMRLLRHECGAYEYYSRISEASSHSSS